MDDVPCPVLWIETIRQILAKHNLRYCQCRLAKECKRKRAALLDDPLKKQRIAGFSR